MSATTASRFLPQAGTKVPDADVEALCGRFPTGVITRRDLTEMGNEARAGDGGACRRLLLGTLMWGYGRRGGRSYRNARAVLGDGTLDHKLEATTSAIGEGVTRAAYLTIRHLRGYDEGFFTKYLYFAARGRGEWPGDEPRPLIFDSTVQVSLDFLGRVLGSDWRRGWPARCAPVDRYARYCETLASWAGEISVLGSTCAADQLEYFLYGPGNLRFDTSAELRKLAAAAVADVEQGDASPRLQAAVESLPVDLVASLSEEAR